MKCEECEHLCLVDQDGFRFWVCFCPPYNGKSIGEIEKCPIGKEIF